MRDSDALRAYFDLIVEHVDAADVMAQSMVRDDAARLRRPALAVVVAFACAVMAVGGVLALALLAPLDERAADVTADEFQWVIEAPPKVGPVIGVIGGALAVAASAGVLLWVIVPALAGRYRGRDTGMKTIEREVDIAVDHAVKDLRNQRRWLVVLVAFLVATTVGFGVWAISLAGDEDLSVVALEGELTTRQQEMLDFLAPDGAWGTAWTAGSGEDMAALFTPNGYHAGLDGVIYRNADGSLAGVLNMTGGAYPDITNRVVFGNFVVMVAAGDASGSPFVAAFELTKSGPIEVVSLVTAG